MDENDTRTAGSGISGRIRNPGVVGIHESGKPILEVVLAIAIVAVVIMMVLPLTPWLMDLLLSINIAGSVLLISVALFIKNPISFTVFPTLLLIATLFRLALNVSSTRLILLRADAGRVIDGFGGVVVGGDIVVGAVVFAVLTLVLFLVITKGAERVAEVAARFTLDALPGMQLAIDSDIRSGAVSSAEGVWKRAKLEQTSRYYGSLDGAMKFVRGDALAGLVIIGINIGGGLAIGMGRRGMSLEQALDTYTRLTIGDGLVTLLPALFISTAAGLLVTRVGQGEYGKTLGEQLGIQMMAEPMALASSSLLLMVLSLIPGLPFWPFMLLGLGLCGLALVQFRAQRRRRFLTGRSDHPNDPTRAVPFAAIEVGKSLYSALSKSASRTGGWPSVMERISAPLREDLGMPIGIVPVVEKGESQMDPFIAVLKIRGVVHIPSFEQRDLSSSDGGSTMVRFVQWASDAVISKSHRILGVDETQRLVDHVAQQRPVLVRETVPQVLKLPALTQLLRKLLRSRISLEQLPEVLEIVANNPSMVGGDDLLATVRRGLRSSITRQLLGDNGEVVAAVLNPSVQSVLEDSLVKTKDYVRLSVNSELASKLVDSCRQVFENRAPAALIVNPNLRGPLADLLEDEFPAVAVVTSAEMDGGASVNLIGEVTL